MRITLIRPNGHEYSIDAFNADTITTWLEEWFPRILSDKYITEWKIRIWASTKEEHEFMGQVAMVQEMTTEEGFKKLENYFRRKSGRNQRKGRNNSGTETVHTDRVLSNVKEKE